MALMFTAQEIVERDRGLTFDDVLLMPMHSTLTSRRAPNLESRLTKNIKLKTPTRDVY
jgi:IMP dehydrogenase